MLKKKPRLEASIWPQCQAAIVAGISAGFSRWYRVREGRVTAKDEEALASYLQRELEQALIERFDWKDDA